MLNIEVLGSIKELIRPILAEEGLSLFHSNFHIYRSRATLKLLVDKTHGGITLDQCTILNDRIGQLIDETGIREQRYILEVSSPGIDRPLKTKDDFVRCINHKVRIFFEQSVDGKFEALGQISSVTEKGLNLELGGESKFISFNQINRGKQIIEEGK